MIMIVLKIVRELHQHQVDNLVDIVGYTACLSEMLHTPIDKEGTNHV
jgi:hypothetical protein